MQGFLQYKGEGLQYPPPVVNVPPFSQDEINIIFVRKNENGDELNRKGMHFHEISNKFTGF